MARRTLTLGLITALSIVIGVGVYFFPRTVEHPATRAVAYPAKVPAQAVVEVSFVAVGDILLSRHVANRIQQSGDVALPFRGIADLLLASDFNFGNLESPVSGNDRVKGKNLIFNTATAHLNGLALHNFKIVNLANNHALDQGVDGLRNTRRELFENGISYVGVGDDKDESWTPKIIESKSIRIGFLGASYASINDGGSTRNNYVARIEDLEHLSTSLAKMKTMADFIVVTMHAGIEYKRQPHRSQVSFARAAIDNGADLVVGVHPHWIQTIEQYQGKYIFYSLGNFIFDQGRREDTRQGLALRVVLHQEQLSDQATTANSKVWLDRIELVPVVIENCIPRRADGQEAPMILRKIGIANRILR